MSFTYLLQSHLSIPKSLQALKLIGIWTPESQRLRRQTWKVPEGMCPRTKVTNPPSSDGPFSQAVILWGTHSATWFMISACLWQGMYRTSHCWHLWTELYHSQNQCKPPFLLIKPSSMGLTVLPSQYRMAVMGEATALTTRAALPILLALVSPPRTVSLLLESHARFHHSNEPPAPLHKVSCAISAGLCCYP